MKKSVYSICGMCAVRCPIRVEVENGKVVWIEGNPNDAAMGRSLCAKGASGIALEYDHERPQAPMIRVGPRGAGQWKTVSWDEALDHVAGKLKTIMEKHGGKAIALSDRGGPYNDLTKAFLRAVGSPNYFTHGATCERNAHHAVKNLLGYGRGAVKYDYKNTKHMVFYGRNIVESIMVKEVKAVTEGLAKGAKMTYIDPRASVTAGKATRYWRIKPGTDYALNLAIIHTLIKRDLYDKDFVTRWTTGFPQLAEFVKPYTPEWAEQETEIPAEEIVAFCQEVAEDAPHVIFHGGWMNSRYPDSLYASRMAVIINVLLGSVEMPGGMWFAKGPGAAGRKGLKTLVDLMPKPTDPRCDGVGTEIKHIDAGPGLIHLLYPCIETGKPYPVKAYFAYRHDPLLANPDPEEQKRIFENLDLLVSIDVNYSETAWHADVILPEATYLERDNILQAVSGLKPAFYRRQKAVEPLYDTKPMWWIVKELLKRLGKGDLFPFETIEDIWNYQLKDTDVKIGDFDAKGFVSLAKDPIWMDRKDGLKFPTPSGKIELVSSVMEKAGVPSFKPYEKPSTGPEGSLRLTHGRCGYQAHGQSTNNPALHELLKENVLWINTKEAAKRGIKDGAMVEVSNDAARGKIRAYVTDFIHPDVVFMLHGFGRTVPAQTRAYGKGLADQIFAKGLLSEWDKAGGGVTLLECFVNVQPAS